MSARTSLDAAVERAPRRARRRGRARAPLAGRHDAVEGRRRGAPEDRRQLARAGSACSRPCATRSTGLSAFVDELRAEGYRTAVLLGMGGSSLAPEVMAFAFGTAPGYLELTVLDTTDPAAVAAVEARLDLESTLFIVASKSGGTTETASLARLLLRAPPRARRRPRRAPLRGHHRRRHVAGAGGAGAGLPRRVRQSVATSAAATRRCASSAWCRRRSWASTSARLLDGVRAMAQACGPDVPPAETRRRCASAPTLGEAGARRPRQGHPRRLARRRRPSAPGSSSSSPRAPARRARGSSRSTSSRSGRPRCTATTASSCTCACRGRPTPPRTRRWRRSRTPASRSCGSTLDDVYDMGGAVPAVGGRRGRGRGDPRHRPLRPAQRAGEQGQHAARARRDRGRRGEPALPARRRRRGASRSPSATTASSRRCATCCAALAPPGLRRPAGLGHARRRRPRRSCRPCARRCATRCAWPPATASARASCTPPASTTRAGPAHGVFLQLVSDGGPELPVPGQAVHVRRAQARAGARRPAGARRRTAAACCASTSATSPSPGWRRSGSCWTRVLAG